MENCPFNIISGSVEIFICLVTAGEMTRIHALQTGSTDKRF